jgi:hypothetical protein
MKCVCVRERVIVCGWVGVGEGVSARTRSLSDPALCASAVSEAAAVAAEGVRSPAGVASSECGILRALNGNVANTVLRDLEGKPRSERLRTP